MVTYFVAGALLLCSSCGNSSVGAQSYYGGNTMQNRYSFITWTNHPNEASKPNLLKLDFRLLSAQRGGTAPISSEFQMPPKSAGFDQPRDYI